MANRNHPSISTVRSAGALVAFMWFAYFLNYCDRQAVFSMFPSLRADLKMSDQELGLVGAMFLWVYAFGCPISGYLGDRFSKRLLVVLILVVWSIVTIGTGFVASGAMLLAMRAAMGVSESLYMSSAVAPTANAYSPEKRSRAVSVLMTGQIAGTVAGSWVGGWMADRGQWREAFLILGAAGVLYAQPYFIFLLKVGEPAMEPGAAWSFTSLGRSRTFLMLCGVFPVFVSGLFSGLFIANIFPAAFDVVPHAARATAVGLLNFFGAIMSGFATLFGGMWKQSLGIDRPLSFTALGCLMAGAALIFGVKTVFPRDHARHSP